MSPYVALCRLPHGVNSFRYSLLDFRHFSDTFCRLSDTFCRDPVNPRGLYKRVFCAIRGFNQLGYLQLHILEISVKTLKRFFLMFTVSYKNLFGYLQHHLQQILDISNPIRPYDFDDFDDFFFFFFFFFFLVLSLVFWIIGRTSNPV